MNEKTLALSRFYAKQLILVKCLKNQPNRDQRSFSQRVTISCIGTRHQRIRLRMKGYAMVNNSSKLNNLCFDTRIITFPSKEKGEFDQPNSLDLSLPVTYNRRYLTKLSVVKSDYFPFGRLLFPE